MDWCLRLFFKHFKAFQDSHERPKLISYWKCVFFLEGSCRNLQTRMDVWDFRIVATKKTKHDRTGRFMAPTVWDMIFPVLFSYLRYFWFMFTWEHELVAASGLLSSWYFTQNLSKLILPEGFIYKTNGCEHLWLHSISWPHKHT